MSDLRSKIRSFRVEPKENKQKCCQNSTVEGQKQVEPSKQCKRATQLGSDTWRDRRLVKSHELPTHTEVCRFLNDAQTGMLPGYPESAICVQRFDDSLNSAIHTTYRNWLRSSSMHEPRDPPLEVVTFKIWLCLKSITYMRLQVRQKT